jgi:ParB family transcriptional regulator, chromosome partitioning protein
MRTNTLQEIPIEEISANPHNPRLFWDEDQLSDLKESISKVGVLVPLTVFESKQPNSPTKYILLDGERRWRCTKELGLRTIKANIIDEPEDITQNILYMFNIHGFKREWEIFPTALKLEVLIKEMGTKESVLASSTGLKISMIRDCKKLLWYPKKYRNLLMDRDPKISTGFFIELYPIAYRLSSENDYLHGGGLEYFIDTVIEKFKTGNSFLDVKELRQIRKCFSYFDSKNNPFEFLNRMKYFLENIDESISVFDILDTDLDKQRTNLVKLITTLSNLISEIDPDLLSDTAFLNQITILRDRILKLIDKID